MPEKLIDLDIIDPNPRQKRTVYRDIPDLARTIAIDGLQQVPKARYFGERVQIKFGHRRREAFLWLRKNWKTENLPDRYNGYTVMQLDIEDLTDEQMFRGVTIENSQRDDLSPIERMEEMKTWVEFGYTSEQIAAMYPNMTASTVRGFLAFDSLQPVPKEALHAGKITQGTARVVNTLQKLADPKTVADLVQNVAEGKTESNRWMSEQTPEAYLIDEIDSMENVVELWRDTRDGKPRAKSLWLLDMKNFPNKYLPMLTVEEALNAIDDESQSGKVESFILDRRTAGLSERDEAILYHLIEPTACSACPWYGKIKGTHYCGIKTCYERKVRAWHRHEMHEASKKLGVAIYEPEADGNLLVLQDTWSNSAHLELWKKKGKDLRLAFMEDIDRKKFQSGYDGCPSGTVVGIVGDTLKKLEKQKVEAREEKHQGVDIEAMIERLQAEKADALLWEATLYVKALFDDFPHLALEALYDAPRYSWGTDNSVPEPKSNWSEKQNDEHTRREFAYHMLDHADGIERSDPGTLADFSAEIVKIAKSWGVKIPASFAKLAVQMDAEIAAVSAEAKAKAKGKSK